MMAFLLFFTCTLTHEKCFVLFYFITARFISFMSHHDSCTLIDFKSNF